MKTRCEVIIECFTEPAFGENAYVVSVRGAPGCWFIDPGLPPSAAQMLHYVAGNKLTPQAIVQTHAHPDHFAGIPEILAEFPDLPVYLADSEAAFLTDPRVNLSAAMGLPIAIDRPRLRDLPAPSTLTLEGSTWLVFDTSGHSPGGRSLYCREARVAIVGDALFAGSIGRTDFPHSDHDRLIANIKTHLLALPDDTAVLSGHGPATTIGQERRHNPFVGDSADSWA